MVVSNGNGVTVGILDANGMPLADVAPNKDEPRSFRFRLISAAPGSRFTVSVTIEKHFHWMDADTLFLAIAYDDGDQQHIGDSGLTQAWVISKSGDYLGERLYKGVTTWADNEAERTKTTYLMPDCVPAATPEIIFDSVRHRSKQTLVPYRGCISIYVHRGRFELEPMKRRPSDPPTSILNKTSFENNARARINFESFEPLRPKTGNVCEFHFRNINAAEFGRVATTAPPTRKARDTPAASSAPESGEDLDPTVARTSKGLRGLSQVNYSIAETWARHGFPWDEENSMAPVQEQASRNERSSNDRSSSSVSERRKRQRIVTVEDDDEDDEEIFVGVPARNTTKEEHPQETSRPSNVAEQRNPTEATMRTPVSCGNMSESSKAKRELEMELEEAQLDKRILQIKRRLMNFG